MRSTMQIVALLACLALLPRAESQPTSPVQFDVVSVKPGDPSAPGQMVSQTPGRYEAHSLTLLSLILSAYRINADQLIGGPAWLTSAGWDIEATFPVTATDDQKRDMLPALLADRFGLVAHHEARMLPIYRLSVAKNGPKLKAGAATDGGMSAGPRMIRFTSATMTLLADQLSNYLQRQVVDATDLKGRYEIDLKFAPVEIGAAPAATDAGPTIFTAVQEQLGLKLDSTRGMVDVVVVDKVNKPSQN